MRSLLFALVLAACSARDVDTAATPEHLHRRLERAETVIDLLSEMNRKHVQDALEARVTAMQLALRPYLQTAAD